MKTIPVVVARLGSLWDRWRPVRNARLLQLQAQLRAKNTELARATAIQQRLEAQIIEIEKRVGEHLRLIAEVKLAIGRGGYLLKRAETPGEYEYERVAFDIKPEPPEPQRFVRVGPVQEVVIRIPTFPGWERSDPRFIGHMLADQIVTALMKIVNRDSKFVSLAGIAPDFTDCVESAFISRAAGPRWVDGEPRR